MSELETITHINPDGTITFQRHQDSEGILESNRQELRDGEQKKNAFGRKVATIPNGLIEKWMKEEGLDIYQLGRDPEVRKRLFKKLNDPEFLYLRTHDSRL